ncbi:MAG: hypothetical protein R2724_15660 [Bryobacterales bacterium]
MIITKKALPRRTFLRGIGASMALPLLDAMVPALSASGPKPVRRLGYVRADGLGHHPLDATKRKRSPQLSSRRSKR